MRYVTKIVAVLAIVISLAGCGTPVRTEPVIQQEILLTQCSKDTPIPEGTTGKDLMETLIKYQTMYNECASTHDALINTIRELRNVKKI